VRTAIFTDWPVPLGKFTCAHHARPTQINERNRTQEATRTERQKKKKKQYRGPELLVIVLGVEVHAEVRLRRLDKLGAGHLLHQ